MLAGEGMSQVVRSLQELLARRTYYSGDLLFSVDILRNVTDTFKRATYVPSADDVQVPPRRKEGGGWRRPRLKGEARPLGRVCFRGGKFGCSGGSPLFPGARTPCHSLLSPQRFFQVVSFMVDAENKEKWDDAQQVRGTAASFSSRDPPCLGPLHTLCPQVSPGSVHLLRVVEDFIHLVGDALKAFQSSLIVTDNLGRRRQAGEGVLNVPELRRFHLSST